jgi:hypothetical protein
MNLSNVISILEDDKYELVEDLKKAKMERLKLSPFEGVKFLKKITGAEDLENDICYYERCLDEITEALRILKIASDESYGNCADEE